MVFSRLWRRLVPPPHLVPAVQTLPAYVALGYWSPARPSLEPRLEILIQQLAAELSGCRWCIARGRHRWRKAFLPRDLLARLGSFETSQGFTDGERAALALVQAVARHSRGDPAASERAIERARRHFAEPELARIAAAAAGEHFFDPATGGVGRDADGMPWRAIEAGIVVRGLW